MKRKLILVATAGALGGLALAAGLITPEQFQALIQLFAGM